MLHNTLVIPKFSPRQAYLERSPPKLQRVGSTQQVLGCSRVNELQNLHRRNHSHPKWIIHLAAHRQNKVYPQINVVATR